MTRSISVEAKRHGPLAAAGLVTLGTLLLLGPSARADDQQPASPKRAEPASAPPAAAEVRKAIEKALPFLEKGGLAWMYERRECTACHHAGLLWSFNEARARGIAVDDKKLDEWTEWWAKYSQGGLWSWRARSQKKLEAKKVPESVLVPMKSFVFQNFPTREDFLAELKKTLPPEELNRHQATILAAADRTFAQSFDVYSAALMILGRQPARTKHKATWRKLAESISNNRAWKTVGPDSGYWFAEQQFPNQKRPKLERNQVNTVWVVLALSSLEELPEAAQKSRDRALRWLKPAQPGVSTESLFLQLLLARQLGQQDRAQQHLKILLKEQKADGGWSWLRSHSQSDALTTGQVLFALSIVGGNSVAIQRAQRYLLANQRADGPGPVIDAKDLPTWRSMVYESARGSWPVPNAAISKKNPASGLRDAFYQYWGTSWAVIGLLRTLPKSASVQVLAQSKVEPKDWTTVRGDAARTGSVQAELRPPFRLAWARHIKDERIGSAVEPIVADGKVYLATHQGNVYALDADSGQPLWRFQAHGAFLHSPAHQEGLVIAANTDGRLYALDDKTGKPRWTVSTAAGGFAGSPTLADGAVFIGSRTGEFLAVELSSGKIRWRQPLPAPVRQTAAWRQGHVFFAAEDLRVRCLDGKSGKVLWTSEPLSGQTARDSHPVVVQAGKRTLVVIRTNPVIEHGQVFAHDQHLLCRNAGVDSSEWKKVEAWIKSEKSQGNPDLWAKEQTAITGYLRTHPEARTFYVLDAETGKETGITPVLHCAGCQGVGPPPVVMPDGRLLVFYRTAYGNWTMGVAPLVGLGLMDPADNRITPLRHKHGRQPPWNTISGTADESQNFVAAGNTLLIVHQSTLSGFDLTSKELFSIHGDRDSWGGYRNLPWARNEWNGPARGGVAVVGKRIYWQTGSRLLCLVAGNKGEAAKKDEAIEGKVPTQQAEAPHLPGPQELRKKLGEGVVELLSRRWAPLYTQPGTANRELSFDDSGTLFETLAWAYPHLSADLQKRVKTFLAQEWRTHPPFSSKAKYSPKEGERRELFRVPADLLKNPDRDKAAHPFGNYYSVWLYAARLGEWERVRADWQPLKAGFEDFVKTKWRLDSEKGHLFANRYLAALGAFARIARKIGDKEMAQRADQLAAETTQALLLWWQRSAKRAAMPVIPSIKEWDEFIVTKGDVLFFPIHAHKAKLALFHDLTPEVAAVVKAKAPQAVDKVWRVFETLCPTWHLQGEERQVHYGENFLDPPDFALDAFKAAAWLKGQPAGALVRRLDIPFCRADLDYLTKLAVAQE